MNTNSPDQPNHLADELSLFDIIEFIQEFWKTIVVFTVLGIAGALLYLSVTPKQFEAIAQIKMAQIANNKINPTGTNIEESSALIARMALPTTYPKETIALCGLAEQKDPEVALAGKVKLSVPKGLSGIVELRIRDASKEIAKACANAVYQLIKSSQAQIIAPFIDEAGRTLTMHQESLSRSTQMISKADRSGSNMTATYLSIRDEIRYLLDQISVLQSFIASYESRATHLVAPIYINAEPVFPQRRNNLLIGLLLGGFLGLMVALARKLFRSQLHGL